MGAESEIQLECVVHQPLPVQEHTGHDLSMTLSSILDPCLQRAQIIVEELILSFREISPYIGLYEGD